MSAPTPAGDEKNAEHWYELGKYHSKHGNARNAILNYKKAVALDPTHNMAWSNLAAEYFRLKDYENAVDCARQAIRANSADSLAWLNLAASYFQVNEDGRALFCFQRARDLGNDKAQTFLANAEKARDKMLRAAPVDVSREIADGIKRDGTAEAPGKRIPKQECITIFCAQCGHRMVFVKNNVTPGEDLVCEKCGAVMKSNAP